MLPWWTLLILAVVAALLTGVGAKAFVSGAADESFRLGVESGQEHVKRTVLALNRERGLRVLVDVNDFGASWGDSRWHWTLWDADKHLAAAEQEWGCTRPFREGAAATQGFAYSQAIQAVLEMREESGADMRVVVR